MLIFANYVAMYKHICSYLQNYVVEQNQCKQLAEINMLKYLIDMSKLYIDLNEVGEYLIDMSKLYIDLNEVGE